MKFASSLATGRLAIGCRCAGARPPARVATEGLRQVQARVRTRLPWRRPLREVEIST